MNRSYEAQKKNDKKFRNSIRVLVFMSLLFVEGSANLDKKTEINKMEKRRNEEKKRKPAKRRKSRASVG